MKMNRFFFLFTFLALFFSSLCTPALAKDVYTITVNGAITPPISGFIKESIDRTHERGGEALLVFLDTPGGLDTAMREIIKNIMDAPVPVIVYVAPSGARAASAGAIILMSAHVAAMAPGTNVGAAHPVSIGHEQPDKTMMKKVLNDSEAYARSIAIKRGRNEEWAAKAVKESVSITADEALKQRVIDTIANNADGLLANTDGRTVEIRTGKVVLKTKGAAKKELPMSVKYKFLSYICDPNVAYLLMMLGMLGIAFEIYSPGAIFPGVAGGISIILALYAFQTIPISFAGLALIILAAIFFILEIKIVSHGALGIAGVISLVIGSIMLVDDPSGVFSISWKSITAVACILGAFILFILFFAVKSQMTKAQTGAEGLLGETGVAKSDITNKGKIYVHGELWNAKSTEPVREGEEVVVVGVEGLLLKIKRKGE